MDPGCAQLRDGGGEPGIHPRATTLVGVAALDAAVSRQDFAPFEQLLKSCRARSVERPGYERYAAPPAPEERVQQDLLRGPDAGGRLQWTLLVHTATHKTATFVSICQQFSGSQTGTAGGPFLLLHWALA